MSLDTTVFGDAAAVPSIPDAGGARALLMGTTPMANPGASNVQRNRTLHAMSNSDLALLQPHLEHVPLKFRQHLQSSNRQIKNVYFPESGIASVVAACAGERSHAEIAVVGREGMTGLAVVHGTDRS